MSTDDKDATCSSDKRDNVDCDEEVKDVCKDEICEKKSSKPQRKVSFPEDDQIVTQYFEPPNPWHDVPTTSRAQLAAEYLDSCRRHRTPPIDTVLEQIRELPETTIGGCVRAARLSLGWCALLGAAPADALEAVLRKVQFRRVHVENAAIDDEGAEAIFDMLEYYESANAVSISGPRQFGIRGWQAACRMIKKSWQLWELSVSASPLEAAHAPVLARALHTHACSLRTLCLHNAALAGEPLLCLVIALKSNNSVCELRLGDNRLSSTDAAQLASLLRYNCRLQLLDLSNNNIQDVGAGHIADALAEQAACGAHSPASPLDSRDPRRTVSYESRGLAVLVLWNNQLTRNCATYLNKAVRSSVSLCVLNVGRNALGGEGARALAGPAPALVSLGLQAARLGPDAARPLADLIRHDTKLQRLDLRDNRLGGQGLQLIVNAMKENTTLTQIDLDDPPTQDTHSPAYSPSECVLIARLVREVRALCAANEAAPARACTGHDARVHRKISLTCHTQPAHKVPEESRLLGSEPGAPRLRSPAPSPAGSPVPTQHNRFSVTPVSGSPASSSPSTPPTPSRFRVVQVAEPPRIQVNSAEPRKSASRFSVTRNYDSAYNTAFVHSPPHTPRPDPPAPTTPAQTTPAPTTPAQTTTPQTTPAQTATAQTPAAQKATPQTQPAQTIQQPTESKDSNNEQVIQQTSDNKSDSKLCDVKTEVKSDAKTVDKTDAETKVSSVDKCEKECISDSVKDYKDKVEHVSHNETVEDNILKTESKLVKNTTEVTEKDKLDIQVEVTVKTETLTAKAHPDQTDNKEKKDDVALKQIEAITEDLGNLIKEMKDLSTKTAILTKKDVIKVKHDSTQTDVNKIDNVDTFNDVPANFIRDNVVLKKNKSESSLDSPDLEVSRLMNKKLTGSPFCDSSSSLEVSGSSMESLNMDHQKPIIIQESVESDTELDRRKAVTLSTESSLESTSEIPVNNFLNMSVSSNESVSPIIFGKNKKIHGSLSSLEASVSSIESKHDKVMVTSADSGIEYSLQNPSENKEENSSNEGTLTNNSSLKENVRNQDVIQDTLTSSPKRTSSLLDVPAMKNKGASRKISWVAPSSSFSVKPEPEKELKMPSSLEKLLSLFHHPTSIFSRTQSEEEKRTSTTPPRKDSSLTSSFWSWGAAVGKEEKEDKEELDSSEATDSTLSERVQVSFVDESFSRKLDSKTPSTDTENTLSEFQSFPIQGNSETSEVSQTERATDTTDDNLVQKSLVLSENDNTSSIRACDIIDLNNPNDLNKNYDTSDNNKNSGLIQTVSHTDEEKIVETEEKKEAVRPRSFAAVLKASGSQNSLEKSSPDTGQPVDKLPSKVIRGIKENISPENTLTSSMTNTKALAQELAEKQMKTQPKWEPTIDEARPNIQELKAPIATIDEVNDVDKSVQTYMDDIKYIDEKNISGDSGVTSLEGTEEKNSKTEISELEHVDVGKDALSYLIYANQVFETDPETTVCQNSLAQELKDAEIKEKLLDLSPELVIDEAIELPEVFTKETKGLRTSPVIPERAKIKKSNSLEHILQTEKDSPKSKTIAFKIPESTPRDIPERRPKLRSRSGSSPKSLPESLGRQYHLSKLDSVLTKKKKKVSSLGKIARDSLLALNMTEEEIAEFRRSYKLTSVESLRSLESVSEDATSQSGASIDSRCRSCLRTSQESLISLDSITEDCKCERNYDKDKPGRSVR